VGFLVVFWGVLVCLISVFFDGQDVKNDCDITPHPHHCRGTNSHKAKKYYTENGKKQRKREYSDINVAERLSAVVDCE